MGFIAKGLFQILPIKHSHLATYCVRGELISLPDRYPSKFLRALLTHLPWHADNRYYSLTKKKGKYPCTFQGTFTNSPVCSHVMRTTSKHVTANSPRALSLLSSLIFRTRRYLSVPIMLILVTFPESSAIQSFI